MSKVITIACYKGGVAKTTTAVSIAGILSREGRVLVIDTDAQMNLTETFTDGKFERTLYDALLEKGRGGLPIYSVREGLDIVPADSRMATADADFVSIAGWEKFLTLMIRKVKGNYDWIIIDTPAQKGMMMASAIISADSVIVPMSCDNYSIKGLQEVNNYINDIRYLELNNTVGILGVLVTKYRANRRADHDVEEALKENCKELLFETRIRENSALVQAPFCKQDIISYAPKSHGAEDYQALVEEIKNRLQ